MKKNLKKLAPFIGLATLLFLVTPQPARAEGVLGFLFGDILFTVIGKIAFGISWIISVIFGIGIAIEAWFIEIILSINMQIVNSPAVQSGFPVTLSIANLGFVLGIVVIAIMTILRSQTYGLKQTLWKLIVAALLVNFSLVIAGSILSFPDRLTVYFLDSVNPAGTNSSYSNFASSLAGAFNPQRSVFGFNSVNDNAVDKATLDGLEGSFATGASGSAIAQMLTVVTSIVFVVLSLLFVVITLGAFIVMLVVRYVTIALLLVLMPFAWLGWIFPYLKGSTWDKWWSSFLKQAFFAPMVVFFLWLAVKTSENMSRGTLGDFSVASAQSGGIWDGIKEFFGAAFSGVIGNLLQMTVVLGLMLGGLFAAHKLSLVGAKGAFDAAKGLGTMVGGYAGRAGMRTANRAFNAAGGQKATSALQNAQGVGAQGTGWGSRIARGLGVTALTGAAARYAGRGLDALSTQTGEKTIERAKDRIKGMTEDQKRDNFKTLPFDARLAVMEEFSKKGKAHTLPMGADLQDKDAFERYGKGNLHGELQKAVGATGNMLAAGSLIQKKGGGSQKMGYVDPNGKKDTKTADEVFKEESEWLDTRYTTEDLKKIPPEIFKPYDEKRPYLGLGREVFEQIQKDKIRMVAKIHPEAIPRIAPKLKPEDHKNFTKAILREKLGDNIEIEVDALAKMPDGKPIKVKQSLDLTKDLNDKEIELLIEHLLEKDPRFGKAVKSGLSSRLTGFAEFNPESGASGTPAGGETKKT